MRDEKRLQRLRRSLNNVSPEELDAVLTAEGYRHPTLTYRLSVPYRRPLKPAYVRIALRAIDDARSQQ